MLRVLLVGSCLVPVLWPGGAAGAAGGTDPVVDRIVLVVPSGIDPGEIGPETYPQLYTFMTEEAAIGVVATRGTNDHPRLTDLAVTISAGARASGSSDFAQAYDKDERLPLGPEQGDIAGVVFQRRTGIEPARGAVIPSWHRIVSSNAEGRFGAVPGTLADALGAMQWTTGAILSGDSTRDDPPILRRGLAAAVAHPDGTFDQLITDVVKDDVHAPSGQRMDGPAIVHAIDSQPSHSFTVVSAADLDRVSAMASSARRSVGERWRLQAARRTDDLLGTIVAHRRPNDLLMILMPASGSGASGLAAIAVAGPGLVPGLVESPTAEHPGTLRVQDIGATLVDSVTHEIPEEMEGRALRVVSTDGTGLQRLHSMQTLIDQSWARSQTGGNIPVILAVGLIGLSLLYALRRRFALDNRTMSFVLALVPAIVLSSYWINPFGITSLLLWYLALFTVAAAISGLGALILKSPTRVLLVLLVLIGATIAFDVCFTSNVFQFNGALGFGPASNGRLSGLQNTGYALLGACGLALGHVLVTRVRHGWWWALCLLLAIVVIDGAPFLGEDFGGLITLTPAAVVALVGWRPVMNRRWLAFIGVLTGLIVIAATMLTELSRPSRSRSHMGRFLESILTDPGRAKSVVDRKLALAIDTFTNSAFLYALLAMVVAFGYDAWRRGELPWRNEPRMVKSTVLGVAVLGVAGTALNDSGIVIPAMMMTVLLPVIIAHTDRDRPSLSAP